MTLRPWRAAGIYTRALIAGSRLRGPSPGNDTTAMARLVMKFGGTSVADIDRIRNVARHVKREVDAGHEVAVVVSAMAGTTNQLVGWCRAAARAVRCARIRCRRRLRRAGDGRAARIALQDMDINARSWQGWQIPILTDRLARRGAHPRHQRRRD